MTERRANPSGDAASAMSERRKVLCSKCNHLTHKPGGRYCRACHREYMREWRKTHPLSEEARRKDNSRSYAHTYLRRGKIVRQPCEVCGLLNSQMHHDDYSKPLEVRWFCRECHLKFHNSNVVHRENR